MPELDQSHAPVWKRQLLNELFSEFAEALAASVLNSLTLRTKTPNWSRSISNASTLVLSTWVSPAYNRRQTPFRRLLAPQCLRRHRRALDKAQTYEAAKEAVEPFLNLLSDKRVGKFTPEKATGYHDPGNSELREKAAQG